VATHVVPSKPSAPSSAEPLADASPKTVDEYPDWLDGDTHAEWADGEVVMHSPASRRHNDVSRFLLVLISAYADQHQSGFVGFEPFQMKLDAVGSCRAPDILFVANEHLDRLQPALLDGPADLVVQVVSPDSGSRDRGEKYYEYDRAGVREYWLVDPERRRAEFYVLGADGAYTGGSVNADTVYRSSVLQGLWLRVGWLWQEPLPSVVGVLREWELV